MRGIEYFSLVRTTEAIARAQVAVLVIDATEGFTGEDKKIANRVMEAGRAFLLVANKWDLVEEKDRTFKILTDTMTPFARATALRTSAACGARACTGCRRSSSTFTKGGASDLDIEGERGHARGSSRTAHTACWREDPLRHPGVGGPPSFVVFGGAKEPGPGYRTAGTWRTGSAASSGSKACPSSSPSGRGPEGATKAGRRDLTAAVYPVSATVHARDGPWRSLVSASDWGSEGRRFESGRPDR